MKVVRSLMFGLVVILPALLAAQESPEISVADINLPNLRWGYQQANFEVTNKTEYLKFISVVTIIAFDESYFKPVRKARSNYVLGPLESKIFTPRIFVPGNYGKATITVQLFDVIDTNDILLPRQKVFEQPITIQYHIPDAFLPYMTQHITFPPIIDHSGTWDNDITRQLPILLRERKTIADIATLANADEKVIREAADNLTVLTALKKTDSAYEPTFAVILASEAEKFRPLAEQLSDSLVAIFKRNLPVYRHVRDSLVKAGVFTADTTDFMNVGGALYHEYPFIGGVVLWHELGKQFVTENKNFITFEGTDYCNAYAPFYMYAVQGGADVNGHHFYSLHVTDPNVNISFADFIPQIECEENYHQKARDRKPVYWQFAQNDGSESFVFSQEASAPAIAALIVGTEPVLTEAKEKFASTVKECGFINFAFGPRYWFWNWAASLTLDKLIKDKTLTRRGNGNYQFQSM